MPSQTLKRRSLHTIFALAYLRLRLLLRQKLGWISIGIGCLLVGLSILVANVSFVNPEKIFWDFSLGVIFVLQVGLSVLLGSQIYSDEKERRTLHLLLTSGVSRAHWIIGNAIGIWLALSLMNLLWFLLTLGTAALSFEVTTVGKVMALQAVLLISVETLVLILFSMFTSFFVRPLIALSASALATVFMHSLGSLQRVFTDPQAGILLQARVFSIVLWMGRALPPLEWLDLKSFVGYEAQMPWFYVAQMAGLGILWAILFAAFSWARFDRMDL